MSFLDPLISQLQACCRSQVEHAARRAKGLMALLVLSLLAGVLLLAAVGFLIAALFGSLATQIGFGAAAAISAGACLLASLILLGIGLWASR